MSEPDRGLDVGLDFYASPGLAANADYVAEGVITPFVGADLVAVPFVSQATRRVRAQIDTGAQLPSAFYGVTEVQGVRIAIANQDSELSYLDDEDPTGSLVRLSFYDEVTGELREIFQGAIDECEVGDEISVSASSHALDILAVELPRNKIVRAGAELPAGLNATDVTVNFPQAQDVGAPINVVFGESGWIPLAYVNEDDTNKFYDYLVCEEYADVLEVMKNKKTGAFTATGVVQAGSTSTTLNINPLDQAGHQMYLDRYVTITKGAGRGQTRRITNHDGTSKVLTVDPWATIPDTTSEYVIREYVVLTGHPYYGRTALRFHYKQVQDGTYHQLNARVQRYQAVSRNLLTFTEQVDRKDAWPDYGFGPTRVAGKEDPTGTFTAVSMDFGDIRQIVNFSTPGLDTTFTFSVWARASGLADGEIVLEADDVSAVTCYIGVDTTWRRYVVSGAMGSGPTVWGVLSNRGGVDIEFWGPQLEMHHVPTPYEGVAEAGQGLNSNHAKVIAEILSNPVWGLNMPVDPTTLEAVSRQLDDLLLRADGALPDVLGQSGTAKDVIDELAQSRGIRLSRNGGVWNFALDSPMDYDAAVLKDGPYGYWKFTEAASKVVFDQVDPTAQQRAVALGGPDPDQRRSGPFGLPDDGGWNFLNVFPLITAPRGASADVFSIEFWIRRNAVAAGVAQPIIQQNTGGVQPVVGIDAADKLYLGASNGQTLCTAMGPFLDTSEYHHVVVTKNGATSKLYYDTVDVSVAGAAYTFTTPFVSIFGASIDADISRLAIYDSALTRDQVWNHYQAGKGRLPKVALGDGDTPWNNLVRVSGMRRTNVTQRPKKLTIQYLPNIRPKTGEASMTAQLSAVVGTVGIPEQIVPMRFIRRHASADRIVQYLAGYQAAAAKQWSVVGGQALRRVAPGDVVWVESPRRQLENLLAWSENFTQSAWTLVRGTIVANQGIDPTGRSSGACNFADNGGNKTLVRQIVPLVPAGRTGKLACWFRSPSGTSCDVKLTVTPQGGSVQTRTFTVGQGWVRCEMPLAFTGTDAGGLQVDLEQMTSSVVLHAWGAHLTMDYDRKPYLRTTAKAKAAQTCWQVTGVGRSGVQSTELSLMPYEPTLIYGYTRGSFADATIPAAAVDDRLVPPDAPGSFSAPTHDPPGLDRAEAVAGSDLAGDGPADSWAKFEWLMPLRAVRVVLQRRLLNTIGVSTGNWEEPASVMVGQTPVGQVASVVVRGFTPGREYEVRTLSINSYGLSTSSPTLTFVARGDTTAPPPPTSLTLLQGTGKSIEARVTMPDPPVEDFAFVRLYMSATPTNTPDATLNENDLVDRRAGVVLHANSIAGSSLSYGVPYYVWARLEDASGNKGTFFPSGGGSSITLSKVAGADIQANTITTQNLTVGVGQILENPSFEAGNIQWGAAGSGVFTALPDVNSADPLSGFGYNIVNGTTLARSPGSWCAQRRYNSVNTSAEAYSVNYDASFGEAYALSAWIRGETGAPGVAWVQISFRRKDNTEISTAASSTVAPTNTWTQVFTNGTAPAGTRYVRVELQVLNHNSTAGNWYFDDLNLRPMVGNVHVLGDLSADKITTGTLTVGGTAANAADAIKLLDVSGSEIGFWNAEGDGKSGGIAFEAGGGLTITQVAGMFLATLGTWSAFGDSLRLETLSGELVIKWGSRLVLAGAGMVFDSSTPGTRAYKIPVFKEHGGAIAGYLNLTSS